MKNIIGNPVVEHNFFNRKRELAIIDTHLANQQSLFIYAQRRMGKTSFIKELMRIEQEKYLFIYYDCMPLTDINILKLIQDELQPETGSEAKYFLQNFNSIIRNNNNSKNKNIIVILDEFSIFLENGRVSREELLNNLKQQKEIRLNKELKVTFIYISETKLSRYSFLTNEFADLIQFEIEPLSKTESFNMMKNLIEDYKISLRKNTKDLIFKISKGNPFNIQLLFSYVLQHNNNYAINNELLLEILKMNKSDFIEYSNHLPPQNDSFLVEAEIEEIIDKTNKSNFNE